MRAFADAIRELPELGDFYEVLDLFGDRAATHVLATTRCAGIEFPILGVVVGAARADAPTLALIGGVHGLERIGTSVVLAGMQTFARLLAWDKLFAAALEQVRVVFLPLLNPAGMYLHRRSNANGVDIMRNAPPHPDAAGTFFLGGQRSSNKLPWFMGSADAPMELETRVLDAFVREWVFPASASIVLDVHSGFGSIDRLWFPYAYTRRPFASLAEAYALACLLDDTLPHHVYEMEPVSRNYTVQGDVWDYLYDEHPRRGSFMPLTLELGSWAWVRKNPRQALDVLGIFNPVHPRRLRRTLRRHLPLIEFLLRAVASAGCWTQFDAHERQRLESEALRMWYAE